MKTFLVIARYLVGILFIISGLVKVNDPTGLSYKMLEYFAVWHWHFLEDYTIAFAVLMNVFEIVAGVALIIGWQMKFFSWLLLLLVVFFSVLTGYAALTNNIKTCGCMGDCIPLKALQSFVKDIVLLILIFFIFSNTKKLKPICQPRVSIFILLISTVLSFVLQIYVLQHLPFVDCLPYREGNNILQQMQLPANAHPDSILSVFTYKKNNTYFKFTQDNLPDNIDEYEYVDRTDKIIQEGTKPKIGDFTLTTLYGNDTSFALLKQEKKYILLFIKNFSDRYKWNTKFTAIRTIAEEKKVSILIVCSNEKEAVKLFPTLPILLGDATMIKTVARANPTYLFMQGATILKKCSSADLNKLITILQD